MNQNLLTLTIFLTIHALAAQFTPPQELLIGFKATPHPSIPHFQPLLTDPSFNYSLGFLRVHPNRLTLSILHVPSSIPLWSPDPPLFPKWSHLTHLLFNGSLVLSDSQSRVFWSTHTSGDRVFLSNTSNLQIVKFNRRSVVWQSFDFPSDTLVENQNFTSSMALIFSNRVYSMILGPNFIGLYAKFHKSDQIYLRHRALEEKGEIVPGRGPVYAVLKSGGYLGLFQSGSDPVDVQSFNSFQQNVAGVRRVRIESDGNLRGYYWTGSKWVLDYKAISDSCELPSFCGEYGLCTPGSGCSCLDNRRVYGSGGCGPPENQFTGEFCGRYDFGHKVMRRIGVELPFKELMGYKIIKSYEECEMQCERNCSCWGAVYSNTSGFCYMLDYPIQTLVAIDDGTKMGYFKVREGAGSKKVDAWLGLGLGLVFGAILICAGVLGLRWYELRFRGVNSNYIEDDGFVYKDLGAASFRTIELCEH